MLNPSTASAVVDDPTVVRCARRAHRIGGGIVVVNLFAYRATRPAELASYPDPVGELNDEFIRQAIAEPDRLVIAGWGVHGILHGRAAHVTRMRTRLEQAILAGADPATVAFGAGPGCFSVPVIASTRCRSGFGDRQGAACSSLRAWRMTSTAGRRWGGAAGWRRYRAGKPVRQPGRLPVPVGAVDRGTGEVGGRQPTA